MHRHTIWCFAKLGHFSYIKGLKKYAVKLDIYRGAADHRVSILASHSVALGLILGIPNNFSLKVDEIY